MTSRQVECGLIHSVKNRKVPLHSSGSITRTLEYEEHEYQGTTLLVFRSFASEVSVAEFAPSRPFREFGSFKASELFQVSDF